MEAAVADEDLKLDPRVHLAAERTLLAWIRTGLALMGLGFVIARFGLFFHELTVNATVSGPVSTGVSQWTGVSLVFLAALVMFMAALKHYRFMRDFNRGRLSSAPTVSMGVVLSALLALLGLGLAAYLISMR